MKSPRPAHRAEHTASAPPRPAGDKLDLALFCLSLLIAVMAFLSARQLGGTGNLYDLEIFTHQFVVHETSGALLAGAILLLAGALCLRGTPDRIEKIVLLLASRPGTAAATAATLGLLIFGSLAAYRNHPLAMDEYMPFFQAQIFAEGEIYGRFPPTMIDRLIPPDFLNKTFIWASLTSGRVISTYYPGFAIMLTPFMMLGVPWLLNPLLGSATLLMVRHLARRLYRDPRAPGWAMLLTLASPAFTVNAISYYSLTAHLFLNLLFVALLLGRSAPLAVGAGVAGSLALTLNHPVPHTLFALPWLLWLVARRQWRHLGAVISGYLPLSLLLGIGWIQVRAAVAAENALQTAAAGTPTAVDSEGVVDVVVGELLSFLSVLQVPDANFLGLRYLAFLKLFMWVVPLLPLLALVGFRKLRRQAPARLFGYSALVTLGFFMFVVFDQGHGWGYRYFHPALGALPLLAVAALLPSASASPHLRRLVGIAALLSLSAGTALRFEQVHRFIDRHLAQVATAEEDGHQVRFVYLESGYYVEDLIQNDPFLRGPVWTLISHGTRRDTEMIRRVVPGARLAVDRGYSTAWIVE